MIFRQFKQKWFQTRKDLVSVNQPFGWRSLCKLGIALLVLLSLVSHHPMDPGPFNLLMPFDGVHNWLGLSGALLSAVIIDFLGWLGFTIPLFLIFLTGKTRAFKPLRFIPELLEILALTALVALLLPVEGVESLPWVGIWGHVSAKTLNAFPGREYALAILAVYQWLYIRNKRFDANLFVIINVSFMVVAGLGAQLLQSTQKNGLQIAKYISINWLSPLATKVSHSSVKAGQRLKTASLPPRNILDDASLLSRFKHSLLTRLKSEKRENLPLPPADWDSDRNLLTASLERYRERYYSGDSQFFLRPEEEI